MEALSIGQSLWHPCNLDIIEHKIISIRQFEGYNHYVTKSVHPVGACGKITVLLDEHKGELRFVELLDAYDLTHARGLHSLVEGHYYADNRKAELEFYREQRTLWSLNVDRKKQNYEEALKHYEEVDRVVTRILKSLEEEQQQEEEDV